MKRRIVWLFLSFLMALSLVLASCGEAVEEEEEEEGPPPMEEEEEEEEEEGPPVTGDWWDKLGEPEYGGTLIIREGDLSGLSFDPLDSPFGAQFTTCWIESLFCPDWTVDREIWPFNMGFVPLEHMAGWLAESWELTDPLTWTVHLRQGVHWQNKPPVNGREFTAEDVQYSYDLVLATGSGFTEPNTYWISAIPTVERVVAVDKYTVEFRLKQPGVAALYQILEGHVMRSLPIIAREWFEQGDTQERENAVGTGAWIISDYILGSTVVFSRNPGYWGHDERHPQNQLPYVDTFKLVSVPDMSTSVAALRTGKIDLLVQTRGGMTWQQGASLANSNPEINQVTFPNPGFSIDMRVDKEPFTDINVRKALQMAIDRETIAKVHLGGTVDGKPCGVTSPWYKGWVLPYDEWSDDLQAEYGFNPERARELLAEAGYPGGFKTKCLASTNDDLALLQIIKSQFMDIGVDMEIEAVDGSTFRAMVQAGQSDEMTYTMASSMPFGPDWCIRFRETGNRDNFTMNNDLTYDAMVREFDAAATNDDAIRISIEADQYLLRQHWSVQTFPMAIKFAWQPYVKGYQGELIIGGGWYSYHPTRFWIDQDLKKSMGR